MVCVQQAKLDLLSMPGAVGLMVLITKCRPLFNGWTDEQQFLSSDTNDKIGAEMRS